MSVKSRFLGFRGIWVFCACAGLLLAGLAAVPPAQAAPAAGSAKVMAAVKAAAAAATRTVSRAAASARAQAATFTGGDLSAGVDTGADPNILSFVLSTGLAKAAGVPTGSSMNSIVQATYNKAADQPTALATSPPPSLPDATLTQSGSTVTWFVPQSDLNTASNVTEPPNQPIQGYGGLCLNIPSTADGAVLNMQPCDGTQNQHWWIEPDGTVQIFGQCLAPPGTSQGDHVELKACDGSTIQKWAFCTNGSCEMVNQASHLCLDDPNFATAPGTEPIMFACNGGANQLWNLANQPRGSWSDRAIAALAGGVAGAVAAVLCWTAMYAAGFALLSSLALAVCNFMWTFVWTFLFSLVVDIRTGVPINSDALKNLFTSASVAGGISAITGVAGKFFFTFMPTVMGEALKAGLQWLKNAAVTLAAWFGSAWTAAITAIGAALATVASTISSLISAAASILGIAQPANTGPVLSGTAAGLCLDAPYPGGTGPGTYPPDNTAVVIGNCSGQTWQSWPDGTVTFNASCLTPHGNATAQDTPVVLVTCSGAASQVWQQVGNALVNQQSGRCLDDPEFSTTPGTQLMIHDCNGGANQSWSIPGGTGIAKPPTTTCDIYAFYGTPCVAAFSTTRALYANYNGALYRVQRSSDGASANIGLLSAGGDANAAAQDSFCSGTSCTITEIFDQSGHGNNLTIEGPGGNGGQDRGANAAALPITVGGHKAYGVDVEPGVGYRIDSTNGVATNGKPEGMYMVASGTHVNSGCCFDFGNVEANNLDNGASHMDAVNLTTWCGGNSQPCTGSGPWVQADLENGQWLGNGPNPANLGNNTPFVTAMLKNNGQNTFALLGGDSTSGGLSKWYEGPLPPGYAPMHQEGAIVLGTGGDNSGGGVGSWFEGVMTAGYPITAADNAVQDSIVAAGYAGNTKPAGGGGGGGSGSGIDGVLPSAAGQAVVHTVGAGGAGYSSVFTVDLSNGHLQETYLPAIGDAWTTQDLSAKYGTPPVMAETQPVSLVHCGFTSVYTVDTNGDLQETYLPAIGDPWSTQDLSVNYGTPQTAVTPTAVMHYAGEPGATAGCGSTSVYTVDTNGDLQETYLPVTGFPGDPWHTQDLSVKVGTPHVEQGTSPVSIVHCGFTSVYTVDEGSGQLQETYLPFIGSPWNTQSLSANYGTPPTDTTPTAVVHYTGAPGATPGCGWTSVYTIDTSNRHLQETYLPNAGFPGDPWTSQDLSAKYGTPPVLAGVPPAALVHIGYTSVYTVDEANGQLQETYLPAIGDAWSTQSLSANYGTPVTSYTPIVLLHPDTSGNIDWASVFTIDASTRHLQETYLPNIGFPGDPWITQDLSAKYGTPTVRP